MLAITALSHGTVPITEMKYIDYTELGTAIFLPISKETPNPLASTDWFTCCANVKTMISSYCLMKIKLYLILSQPKVFVLNFSLYFY